MKNPLNRLLNIIEEKSGSETLAKFQNLFETSPYEYMLEFNKTGEELSQKIFSGLAPINNKIENDSLNPLRLSFYMDLDFKIKDSEEIKDIFELFVNATYHSNPLGHFRTSPEFYAGIYSGARYFAFHGDGNCFAVSMIFQGFVKKLLEKNIDVHYGALANRSYMHAFCMNHTHYIDPDLKTYCSREEIKNSMPVGLIFSLISFAGFDVFNSIPQDIRKRLFPSMTYEFMSDFYLDPQPAIYQKIPSLTDLRKGFQSVYANSPEIVSLEKDDYPWKKKYREAVNKVIGSEEYFFSELELGHEMTVPPKANFSFTFPNNHELPNEIEDLCSVYFGRIPGIITQKIVAEIDTMLTSPEYPWMLLFVGYFDPISINNETLIPMKSRCARYGVLGMGDLEKFTEFSKREISYKLNLRKDCIVKIIFPMNYRALESGLVKIKRIN